MATNKNRMRLTLSCGDYDRTRPLIDGIVTSPDIEIDVIPLPSSERHSRFVRYLEFDICELQVAQFLGSKSHGADYGDTSISPAGGSLSRLFVDFDQRSRNEFLFQQRADVLPRCI